MQEGEEETSEETLPGSSGKQELPESKGTADIVPTSNNKSKKKKKKKNKEGSSASEHKVEKPLDEILETFFTVHVHDSVPLLHWVGT